MTFGRARIVLYPHRNNKTIKGGLDKGEYGRNMDMIMRWIRHMVGANRFHFGITAHPWDGPHPTNDEGNDLLAALDSGQDDDPQGVRLHEHGRVPGGHGGP
jgi:hypothetical protein